MFLHHYWPLAMFDFADKTRQAQRAGLYLAACFNPALAWWLAYIPAAQNQASQP
jgi:hypothetical protein